MKIDVTEIDDTMTVAITFDGHRDASAFLRDWSYMTEEAFYKKHPALCASSAMTDAAVRAALRVLAGFFGLKLVKV